MPPNVYLDTCVWIAYIRGEEDQKYDAAEKIMLDVKHGKMRIIMTDLVLLEILNVLRKIEGRNFKILSNMLNDQERTRYVNQKSSSKFREFVDEITKVPFIHFKKVSGINLQDGILSPSLEFMWKYPGNVRLKRFCRVCKTRKPVPFFSEYKGLGPVDLMHILLAVHLGCEYFITFDRDFRALSREPYFAKIIKIKIL